jgi:hypothetical protein
MTAAMLVERFAAIDRKASEKKSLALISVSSGDAAELLGREHQARGRTRAKPRLAALVSARVASGAA